MPEQLPKKYTDHRSRDPFPAIQPALLNSADIKTYADKVGLLDPFEPARRKSASYEIPFFGTIFVWNAESKQRESTEITKTGEIFSIEPNSIAYIYLATKFYLPEYIAVRFNLKITQVHRGLLLGTGPLVDPGFYGRLLIPLHNLTANRYCLVGGEGFIWVEFTKLSPNSKWAGAAAPQAADFEEFPDRKLDLQPEAYFERANRGNPIISSIPAATLDAKRLAEESKEAAEASAKDADQAATEAKKAAAEAEKLKTQFDFGLKVSLAGVAIALTGLIYAGYTLINGVNVTVQAGVNYVKSQSGELTKQADETRADLLRRIDYLDQARSDLLKRIDQLERGLEKEKQAKEQGTSKKQSPVQPAPK